MIGQHQSISSFRLPKFKLALSVLKYAGIKMKHFFIFGISVEIGVRSLIKGHFKCPNIHELSRWFNRELSFRIYWSVEKTHWTISPEDRNVFETLKSGRKVRHRYFLRKLFSTNWFSAKLTWRLGKWRLLGRKWFERGRIRMTHRYFRRPFLSGLTFASPF